MRKERMTEEEYLLAKYEIQIAKCEIQKLKTEIDRIRNEKNKLVDKVRWYEYSAGKLSKNYEAGFSYKHFGKRYRDLTDEERKEYRRMQTNKSRNRR